MKRLMLIVGVGCGAFVCWALYTLAANLPVG